jgi:hypothetical protein
MKMNLKKTAAGLLAVVVLTFGLPASPAYAIDRVACGNRTDFLMLEIDLGGGWNTNQCYANAGATSPDVGGVRRISSGNNRAMVSYSLDGRFYTLNFEKWEHINFIGRAHVYHVSIW